MPVFQITPSSKFFWTYEWHIGGHGLGGFEGLCEHIMFSDTVRYFFLHRSKANFLIGAVGSSSKVCPLR